MSDLKSQTPLNLVVLSKKLMNKITNIILYFNLYFN